MVGKRNTPKLKSADRACVMLALVLVMSGIAPAVGQEPAATAGLTLSPFGYPRLAFDPSGTRLAAALQKTGEKGRVVFLNVPDLAVVREVSTDTEPQALSFSPLGDFFALSLARGEESSDLRFVVLSTKDWSALYAERGLRNPVASLSFDPVGDFLLVGGTDPTETFRFVLGTWQRERMEPLDGIQAAGRSLCVSPDAGYAAMGTQDGRVLIWPLNDSDQALQLGTNQLSGTVNAVAFDRSSQQLVAGDASGNILVFSRTPNGSWTWYTSLVIPGVAIRGVGFMNDGSLISADANGDVSRWNLASPNQPVETLKVGPGNAESLAMDPAGRWMAVGGQKISLFPLGSPNPAPATELPTAPWTIVGSETVALADTVQSIPSVGESGPSESGSESTAPPPVSEDHGNFMLWSALGPDAVDAGEKWVQGWAGALDDGRFSPVQVGLEYSKLNRAIIRSNLGNLGTIVAGGDFLIHYSSALLKKPAEEGKYTLAFGTNAEETVPLTEWIEAIQKASGIAPTVWFLDLRPEAGLDESAATDLLDKVTRAIAIDEQGAMRTPFGVGLVTLSKEGSYPELAGNLRDALTGQADDNGDGAIFDRELALFLADRCRTAMRVQAIGNAEHQLPVLPPFRLSPN